MQKIINLLLTMLKLFVRMLTISGLLALAKVYYFKYGESQNSSDLFVLAISASLATMLYCDTLSKIVDYWNGVPQ